MCELKWNKRDSFQNKKNNLLLVCYSTCVLIEMKQEGYSFQKKSNWWQYAAELVSEKKQEGQFSKNNNLLQYAIQLVCVLKWKKGGSFQKNPIDDNMLLNSTRGDSFQKKSNWWQYATELVCGKWNKRGSFQKNKKNNLLQYAIQLVCVLKWNKRGSFQKKSNWWQYANSWAFQKTTMYYCMIFNLCAKMKQEGQFSKKQQKKSNYYSMLFNLCANWNETRGTVFNKKKHKFITVCYSTCVRIEMKQEGYSFQKNPIDDNMLLNSWAKRNKRDSFQKKKTIYYSMLFNLCAYWNETRGTVFKKKHKFITVCYSTCVRIDETRGTVFNKKTQIYYSMLFNLCAKWNKRGSFQKKSNWWQYAAELVSEKKQFSKNNNLLQYAFN